MRDAHSYKRYQALCILSGTPPKCMWDGCDETDRRVLDIDHIHGGGSEHRGRVRIVDWVLAEPDEARRRCRVLCVTHHRLHGAHGPQANSGSKYWRPDPLFAEQGRGLRGLYVDEMKMTEFYFYRADAAKKHGRHEEAETLVECALRAWQVAKKAKEMYEQLPGRWVFIPGDMEQRLWKLEAKLTGHPSVNVERLDDLPA